MKVWVLTVEDDEGSAICGVYSSKEKALESMVIELIGDEANTFLWIQQGDNSEYLRAEDGDGGAYELLSEIVDLP